MANPKSITPDLSKLKLGKRCENVPESYWVVVTNPESPDSPGWTLIRIPETGTLWICYEIGSGSAPAEQIYVFHQGGTTTPINHGTNNIDVGATDCIFYQLSDPANDRIKLAYWLTPSAVPAG
jgi:hypothetical protein